MKKLLSILVFSVITTSAFASVNQVLFDSNGNRKGSGMMFQVCAYLSTGTLEEKAHYDVITKLGDYLVALDVERSGLSAGTPERTSSDEERIRTDRLQMLLIQNWFGSVEAKETLNRYCVAPISTEESTEE